MRTHSLLRSCSIIIPLLYLPILFSLLYSPSNGGNLLQLIFPSWSDFLQVGLPLLFSTLVFGALVFPPLALWVASRLPTRMMSMVGLWISLALSLAACLFFSGLFWAPPLLYSNGSSGTTVVVSSSGSSVLHLLLAELLFRIPFFGFGLSFILCFMLAIRLPLLHTHEQAALRVSWRDTLASIGQASRESSHISEEQTRFSRLNQDFRLLLFASFGLLCHLLIAVSLFFPYIYFYDPYGYIVDRLTPTTGWQLLTQAFQPQTAPRAAIMPALPAPLALVLLTTLILPVLIYLVCLSLWPVKSELKDTGLGKSVYICYVLNLIGLSLSSFFVVFSALSHGGDLHDPGQDTSLAFAIPPIAFLLSLACSYLLVNHFRLRSGPGERRSP